MDRPTPRATESLAMYPSRDIHIHPSPSRRVHVDVTDGKTHNFLVCLFVRRAPASSRLTWTPSMSKWCASSPRHQIPTSLTTHVHVYIYIYITRPCLVARLVVCVEAFSRRTLIIKHTRVWRCKLDPSLKAPPLSNFDGANDNSVLSN